jgi:hypothetical protein
MKWIKREAVFHLYGNLCYQSNIFSISIFLSRNLPNNNGLIQGVLHPLAEDGFQGPGRHDLKAFIAWPPLTHKNNRGRVHVLKDKENPLKRGFYYLSL